MIKRAFTEKEAGVYTGLSGRTLRSLRAKHEGPAFRRFGSRVYYFREALDAWLDGFPQGGVVESKRTSTSGAEAQRRAAALKSATP